MTVKMTVQS